jgi:multicomponent Na+:H+ antiporter subunit F
MSVPSIETIVFALLIISFALATLRLFIGPSLPDRVVALDLISVISAGFIAVYAIDSGQPIFLDAAIVLGLIAFLSTVALAQYIERRARDD